MTTMDTSDPAPAPEAPEPMLICIVPNPSIDKTATVDRLEPGTIHRPDSVVAVPGGKGLNVARAAVTLGVPARAVLLLGGDAGRWMTAELDRRGIACDVTWVDGETRTCLSVLDRATGVLTEFYEPGPAISTDAWRRFVTMVADVVGAAPRGSVAAISGSFPRGAPEDAADGLLRAIEGHGTPLLVDTSGPHLTALLAARPALVKINAAEAGRVLGVPVTGEDEVVAAARTLVERGAERAVVTRGPDGAVAADATRAWIVDPLAGGGPYTVGSGDAFLAGIAAGLLVGVVVRPLPAPGDGGRDRQHPGRRGGRAPRRGSVAAGCRRPHPAARVGRGRAVSRGPRSRAPRSFRRPRCADATSKDDGESRPEIPNHPDVPTHPLGRMSSMSTTATRRHGKDGNEMTYGIEAMAEQRIQQRHAEAAPRATREDRRDGHRPSAHVAHPPAARLAATTGTLGPRVLTTITGTFVPPDEVRRWLA